jgi:putative ABC transport system ATP-binding protein
MTALGTCLAELADVSRTFGSANHETVALRNVTLQARSGELVLLLGPSGSGKTTLLTIIAGLQRPTSGKVLLFGRPVPDYSPRDMQRLRAANIGFVFQTFHLLESLSVLENVILVTRFSGMPRAEARRRAMDLLERFGVGRLASSDPRTLSQGEKQRVAVARALVNGAELILADEPTGSLATQQGFDVVRMIRDCVKQEDRCALVVSHDERIAEFSDRVLHLRDGSLV